MAEKDTRRRQVVMLPSLAQGHLIPFLALARKIHHQFGFVVTIATTPLNARYLRTAIAKSSSSVPATPEIYLYELPFDASDHGLPPNAENTESLPLSRIVDLFRASVSLESPFRDLIGDLAAKDGRPPLCIISDVFSGWTTRVAESFGTVNVTFTTGGAYGTAAYVSMWLDLPHREAAEDGTFSVAGFPESCRFHLSQLHRFVRVADGTDSWSRFFQPQIRDGMKSVGWICNTAEEIEPLGLEILRKIIKLPVWPIGPLLPPLMMAGNSRVIGKHTGREPGISPEKCLDWLDIRPENSVLYISFGSQNSIGASQMTALAKGLENSGKPFIWVIRPPVGSDPDGDFRSEWLPEGFRDRTKDEGLMVPGWAPQPEILCHRATAAFMSHCGWNSAMESLSQGVPLIGWPLAAEQGYNAKMLAEEMGVCAEVTRGADSELTAETVTSVITTVMESEGMRGRAKRIAELIRKAAGDGDGSSS
ncbi:hypothetical protein M569_03738, partial [Genlisea aurea]